MGTMVYVRIGADRDEWIRRALARFNQNGVVFTRSRTFVFWETAAAYALLPGGDRHGHRRRVYRGDSGRWVVAITVKPARVGKRVAR